MLNRFRWSGLLLLGALLLSLPARAQTGAVVSLLSPKTDDFPNLQVYMDVHGADGQFQHDLQAGDVRILENGAPVNVTGLEELHPGLQLAITINPGSPFDIRNSQGVSRYEALAATLSDWANSRLGSSIDDLNLIITAGEERTHFSDPAQIFTILSAYEPSDEPAPGLESLSRAVDIVSDATPRAGMERAILFVTAPLQGDITFGLASLAPRIRQQGIHLFIWYVTSPQLFDTPEARLLTDLTLQTGGQFTPFSGVEPLPQIEKSFNELRDIYQIAYQSQASTGGQQSLVAEVNVNGQIVPSQPLTYDLNLLPPEAAFILPSLEILRQPPVAQRSNLWEQVSPLDLLPKEHPLQILIDFPDGRSRPLLRSEFYVDGVLVDENTQPPFDYFTWDLREYVTSGQHILRVEAQDSLGLTGTSIDTLVQVTVELPAPNPMRALAQRWPIIAGLGVMLVCAILLLILLLGGKINPGWQRLRRGRHARKEQTLAVKKAPETADAETNPRRLPEWVNRFHWPQRRINPRAYAYLTPVSAAGEANTSAPISITTDEITFGTDPQRATLVLADPSVAALHARMIRCEDGDFHITDEGSVAGTWINYSPVTAAGGTLEHGDLIHLGRVCLRFTQREPLRLRKLSVSLQEAEL